MANRYICRMLSRQQIGEWIYRLGLTPVVEKVHRTMTQRKQAPDNAAFLSEHPDFKVPPADILYDAHGLDYRTYYTSGQATAQEILSRIEPHRSQPLTSVLDWGCGPARVVQHLPDLLPSSEIHGCDYDPATIDWCAPAFPSIQFKLNPLEATLPYKSGTMDLVYGLSIFTHLSAARHEDWLRELARVTSDHGLLYLTFHGANYREKLTTSERAQYDAGQLVERARSEEGKRRFGSFHPPAAIRDLAAATGLAVQEHIVTPVPTDRSWFPQDVWIFSKA